MLTAITTAIAVDEIQQNRTLEYVYHYDKIPGMLLFPPGTFVTDDPTLSWSRALSITFATNPRYLYVYQLKVRPADLGPELDPVMGLRQWQLENTVFSFSMIKVLSPGQGD